MSWPASAKLITAATAQVVSLEDAKAFVRVDGSQEDSLITGLIASATEHVEKLIGRSICEQTWELCLDAFADEVLLPNGPVRSVSSIKFDAIDGGEGTVDQEVYKADLVSDPPRLVRRAGASWPEAIDGINSVRIRYVAGYDAVPPPLRAAVLLLTGHWFMNREAVVTGVIASEVPLGVESLVHNYRAWLQ